MLGRNKIFRRLIHHKTLDCNNKFSTTQIFCLNPQLLWAQQHRPTRINFSVIVLSLSLPNLKLHPRSRFKMDASCVVWGIIWLIIFFFIGWPISIFLGGLYGFFAPLLTLISLDDFSEILLKGVNLGRQCAMNVRTGKPLF